MVIVENRGNDSYKELAVPTPLLNEKGRPRDDFLYQVPSRDRDFSREELFSAQDDYQKLTDGHLGYFSNLMVGDDSLLQYSEQEVEASKKAIENLTLEELLHFGRINASNVAQVGFDANPQAMIGYALQVPYFNGSDKFNEAKGKIQTARDTLEKITEDPNAFLQGEFKELSPVAKAFYSGINPQRILTDLQRWQQNAQIIAIGEYGITNFIGDNIGNAYSQGEKMDSEIRKLAEETAEEERSLLEANEFDKLQKLRDSRTKKAEEISEKYDNASGQWTNLTGTLMNTARGVYDAALEEEKKAKEETSPKEED